MTMLFHYTNLKVFMFDKFKLVIIIDKWHGIDYIYALQYQIQTNL